MWFCCGLCLKNTAQKLPDKHSACILLHDLSLGVKSGHQHTLRGSSFQHIRHIHLFSLHPHKGEYEGIYCMLWFRFKFGPYTLVTLWLNHFSGTYRDFVDKRMVIDCSYYNIYGCHLLSSLLSLFIKKKCVLSLPCRTTVKNKSNKITNISLSIP